MFVELHKCDLCVRRVRRMYVMYDPHDKTVSSSASQRGTFRLLLRTANCCDTPRYRTSSYPSASHLSVVLAEGCFAIYHDITHVVKGATFAPPGIELIHRSRSKMAEENMVGVKTPSRDRHGTERLQENPTVIARHMHIRSRRYTTQSIASERKSYYTRCSIA